MRAQTSKSLHTVRGKTILFISAIYLTLAIVTPALADYLGPNRTVTQATSVCKVYINECMYVPAKGDWRYKSQYGWECSNESKPWLAYPSSPSSMGCFETTAGDTYWSKEDVLEEVIVTHPSATISGSLQNCNSNNGWCNTAPELSLYGTEPLAGYNILALEGSRNGQIFACPGSNCSMALEEGNNNFSFWAISSWGDSSAMETITARVDTVPPALGLDINGSSGTNGWFISPVALTATGSDSTSGLAGAQLSIDGGVWETSTTLQEGIYTVDARAQDQAGNISTASTTISVDTTTPSIDLSLQGTRGNNNWFVTDVDLVASATDNTSGVAIFEISTDGSPYVPVGSHDSFSDGHHTVQLRATDHAGNMTETAPQSFSVDTTAPVITLPTSWKVNENINCTIQDVGSGLSALRVVIEDGNEKYAKVVQTISISGSAYAGDIQWDGRFADGTDAPPGDYHVWIKASDEAGNESFTLGIVTVPAPIPLKQSPPVVDSIKVSPAPPRELFEEKWIQFDENTVPVLTFGGTNVQPIETDTKSFSLTTGLSAISSATGTIASTGSGQGVLWGTAALALVSAATAYAIEEKRKRDEEAARNRAEVEAQIEEQNAKRQAAEQARKMAEWLEAKAVLDAQIQEARKHGATEEQIAALRKLGREQGLGAAIEKSEILTQNLAYRDAVILHARDERMADKMQKIEMIDDARWTVSQIVMQNRAEAAANAELQAGLAAYYSAMRQGEDEAQEKISAQESWWQKTWSGFKESTDKVIQWVDQHQTEIAIGIGVVAGIALVVLTAGSSVPFLVAAGSAMWAAGGIVVTGTMALNVYQGRPLGQNLLKNVAATAVAAFVTTSILSFFITGITTLGNIVGGYCAVNQTVCARADTVMNALDTLEEVGLVIKGGIQNLRGDSQGAAETMLELQMEHSDGGIPGNAVADEIGDQLKRLGPEALEIVQRYGDDGAEILLTHGDEVILLLDQGIPSSKKWMEYIPTEYLDEIRATFTGEPIAITLSHDTVVYRYWSGNPKTEVGRWVTLDPNLTPEEARKLLALPNSNLADNISQFTIPAGTTIIVGEATEQTSSVWAGAYATGGGLQIYLPDPSVLVKKD